MAIAPVWYEEVLSASAEDLQLPNVRRGMILP